MCMRMRPLAWVVWFFDVYMCDADIANYYLSCILLFFSSLILVVLLGLTVQVIPSV